MRAAWWWIDRWRKSTAYTGLTLEEQGAYRNLLDELWLRDGVLPKNERYLANVSGDAVRWPAIRDKVMAYFTEAVDGWRNETHDSIQKESHRLADKQKRYREKARGVTSNVTGNVTGDVPRSPSPSPSPSPSKAQRQRKRSSTTTVVARLGHNWPKDACDDWIERFGGTAPGGRIGKALKPLIAKYGWELIRPVWQKYLREEKPEFANPQDFASKLGRWLQKRVPKTKGEHFVAKTREVLKAFLEKE